MKLNLFSKANKQDTIKPRKTRKLFSKFALGVATIMIPIVSFISCSNSDKARIENDLSQRSSGTNVIVNDMKGTIRNNRRTVLFEKDGYLVVADLESKMGKITIEKFDKETRAMLCPDIINCSETSGELMKWESVHWKGAEEIRIYKAGENQEMVKVIFPFELNAKGAEFPENPWWGPDTITHISIPEESEIEANVSPDEEKMSSPYTFSKTYRELNMKNHIVELPNGGKMVLEKVTGMRGNSGRANYYIEGSIRDRMDRASTVSPDRVLHFNGFCGEKHIHVNNLFSDSDLTRYTVSIPEQDLSNFPVTMIKIYVSQP
ncbi:MAG: hypothetical protein WC501_04655 [Candidatus Micrarchaeia archaeon]